MSRHRNQWQHDDVNITMERGGRVGKGAVCWQQIWGMQMEAEKLYTSGNLDQENSTDGMRKKNISTFNSSSRSHRTKRNVFKFI